ncbi:MAG: hypothetical protein CMK65_11850 [Pseudoalteromonas sp.]|uniref:hypothetical protein n=1 Tax=Pseudoalteromonas sp. TaxID=53249 RepID=UPI000C935204|nr:hypothetical protein [Pseudoalteromonas sp.]MAD04292.1 hypothetical protein [Pseudoalteromonas sp.]|tara:strand:+ start:34152 stop:34703 length:552 start_codon:yes stop_codon:yes gene_type:complete
MSNELDELMTDDFLSGLDSPSNNNEGLFDKPPWVRGDTGHTTFKAWRAILDLQAIKEKSIKNYGKVADRKTPKSLYQIKKSEVADIVAIKSQSLFRTSGFSDDIRAFFDDVNSELLDLFEVEQNKQRLRRKRTGVRSKCKPELVDDVQVLREKVEELERRAVKDTLDLMLQRMPLDLRRKLSV